MFQIWFVFGRGREVCVRYVVRFAVYLDADMMWGYLEKGGSFTMASLNDESVGGDRDKSVDWMYE